MSGNADAGDIFDGGGHPFAKSEKKYEWARAKTKLFVVGCQIKTTSQFGEETRYTVAVQEGGETVRYVLSFKFNDVRERQAEAILALFAAGHTSVGPLYMVQVSTKSGNMAWTMSKTPADAVEQISDDPEPEPVAAAASVQQGFAGYDDDIPF